MAWARMNELSALLLQDEYRTAGQLASQLGVSEKTVRLKLYELHDLLSHHGAEVESKARFGYRLKVVDQEQFDAYRRETEQENPIPDSGKERMEYLLAYLVTRNEYVKAEDLCEFMYISKTTLTNALRLVEATLKRYRLSIERRPNYGMRVEGDEFDIRRLMCDYFVKRDSLEEQKLGNQQQEILKLAEQVRTLMTRYNVYLSELSFENFVYYVYVAWKRMKFGNYLKLKKENLPEIGIKEQAFIHELLLSIQDEDEIRCTADEENYLLLYLAGKRMIGNVVENDSNFIIHEKTDKLALDMLKMASEEYHLDFYSNFEMRMTLNQHLVPFDVRMRFDIPLRNPMLSEIKEKYALAYQVAYVTCSVLRNHYQKEISEDEIGYFALIFELEMEKEKTKDRYDILVVCSTGKGTSRLLKYKYEREFGDYIKHIYVCDLIGLETFDVSKVDYIFTTVPISKEVSVPIVEVGVLMGIEDIQKVSDILQNGSSTNMIQRYYGPQRFLTGIHPDTRENILEYICKVIAAQEKVDPDFYEQVLEREACAQMDYGNLVAIPHPNRIASEESFAYVAVLNEPITWNRLPVQVVILTSIGRREDSERQKFYEATARFALSANAVAQLLAYPKYHMFARLLKR
ncbi:MAG: BglG family transcription antiterminator [Lachnospiraceae bacterium]|nr:BglG family transcription antiterminator [Lachnospiraceae bacterium]